MAFGKFGKYYPGGVQIKPEDFDLSRAIREEFEAFRNASAAGRKLVLHEGLGRYPVRTDRTHLKFVFVNLLQNAVKYSPPDGEVRIGLHLQDGRPVLEVADKGIGIPQAELDELFSPFYRASNVGDRPGTGMGLAIVKKSARLLGAEVEVDSQPGEGTRFRVRLPAGPRQLS